MSNFALNHYTDVVQSMTTTLDYFEETSETEVGKIIKSTKPTTYMYSLDPLPTALVKKTSAHMPALTKLIHTSFESGIILVRPLKRALVTPILKKRSRPMGNYMYRPVSLDQTSHSSHSLSSVLALSLKLSNLAPVS